MNEGHAKLTRALSKRQPPKGAPQEPTQPSAWLFLVTLIFALAISLLVDLWQHSQEQRSEARELHTEALDYYTEARAIHEKAKRLREHVKELLTQECAPTPTPEASNDPDP